VLQSFGIFLLIKGEVTGVKEVEKFQDAPEAYIRSSVFYYEGRFNKESFSGMFNDILKDPSAEVRLVIPIILAMTPQVEFKHSFDKDHFSMINRFDYSHYGRFSQSATLTASEQSVLEKLTKDESPKVRAEAFFALLSYKKKVDLTEFVSAIESSPEQNAVTKRVSSFLEENYRTLGQTFVILLPYLEMADSNYKQYDVIKEHFGVESSNVTTAVTRLSRESNNVPVIATFADLPDKEPEVDTTKSVSLLFFTKAGCNACEKISEILPELSSYFPNLEVKTLDIETIKAMEINEFLCDKYGVSQKVRLIAPAVFAANGCLIKEEIGFASLGQLLSRSAAIDDGEWFKMEEEDEEIAKESIIDRYSTFSVGVIALAGFLDGINPCAFATILFLLSYLQFTKRRPKEVSQIGIAFIAGVFIAYFTLGIGLVEVIARLSVLRWLGNVMNAGLAAFALIIMTLSVRDGILCLKGQMNDMTLQLPLFLKKRIHSTIRKGTKHRNFVLAAFVTGGIVSFLELACTGQVYAPTILFMLKTGRNYGGALWCLLIYNLAFIGPLIAVFILTSVGMTNQRLQDYFQGHGALVKFATAGLFFLIFLYLTVGNNLFAL
jgi:cytochrome c biogenesis protein CcdA